MKKYKVIYLANTNGQNEIIIALLSDQAFDSFEELDDNNLKAYIEESDFQLSSFQSFMQNLDILSSVSFQIDDLENKNWNAEWEKNFEAIHIGNRCTVRASFHPKSNAEFELVIEPKMAFGTGHHATTEMVLSMMLDLDFKDKKVLDFGCGTGILSLLAEMKGAAHIDANDIEEPAYSNTIENAQLNNCVKINALHGDISVVPANDYAVILANVTTNTIEENLEKLYTLLNKKGHIFLSGILPEQQKIVEQLANALGLELQKATTLNNWVALHYFKA